MGPKLIALDLDGTLLTSDKRITARAEAAIKALSHQGVHIAICTGRPPRHTQAYAEQLELPTTIVYNGATLMDLASGEVVHLHQLDRHLALAVLASMRASFPEVMGGMETVYGWYLDPNTYAERRALLEERGLAPPDAVGALEGFVQGGVIKLFFRHPGHRPSELLAALDGLDIYATWSGETLLEVMHPAVNKRDALERLCQQLGLDRHQVAAFGDERNDREMLAWAGIGVAMANGSPETRAIADLVTASNDEDGVASVLEGWLDSEATGG